MNPHGTNGGPKLRVLVACEFSGVVRRAFRERGHDAWSCDLLPADDGSEFHIRGDARAVLGDGWDVAICHPPCTYLANSGVRWLHTEAGRWDALREAAEFFRAMLDAPIPMVAVENPIMHGHAIALIGRKQDQIIQPWQFGHGETKATCLWLRNLPKLQPTNVVEGRHARVHREPPSADRWKKRSITYAGIAAAMADQWGGHMNPTGTNGGHQRDTEREAAIIARYRDGQSMKAIGKGYGIGRERVRQILERNGVTSRPPGPVPRGQQPP